VYNEQRDTAVHNSNRTKESMQEEEKVFACLNVAISGQGGKEGTGQFERKDI
jgi:hypothetical protein